MSRSNTSYMLNRCGCAAGSPKSILLYNDALKRFAISLCLKGKVELFATGLVQQVFCSLIIHAVSNMAALMSS